MGKLPVMKAMKSILHDKRKTRVQRYNCQNTYIKVNKDSQSQLVEIDNICTVTNKMFLHSRKS